MLINKTMIIVFLLSVLIIAGLSAAYISIYPWNLVGFVSGWTVAIVGALIAANLSKQLDLSGKRIPWAGIGLAAVAAFYFFNAIFAIFCLPQYVVYSYLSIGLVQGLAAYLQLRR